MSNRIGRILIASWAMLTSGCLAREPVLSLHRLIPAGDHVLLEVIAATHDGGYGQEQEAAGCSRGRCAWRRAARNSGCPARCRTASITS